MDFLIYALIVAGFAFGIAAWSCPKVEDNPGTIIPHKRWMR